MMLRSKMFLTILFLLVGYTFCNAQESRSFFPKDEYEYYMALIRSINSEVYEKMRKCEVETGEPCLEKIENQGPGIIATINPPNEMSHGYPILLMRSIKDYYAEAFQRDLLKTQLDVYNTLPIITPITFAEKKYIMELVKSLDASLYNDIIAVDPDGLKHVERSYWGPAATTASEEDGLPIFLIDQDFMKFSIQEQRAVLAHELGHYVLFHQEDFPAFLFATNRTIEQKEPKFKKIVSGQLPFEETFSLAYSRIQEHEADRFSIIDMQTNIDDAISAAQKGIIAEREHALTEPQKETFKRTHPLWVARIEHLNSLRSEVELQKARNAPRKKVDWQKLAHDYLKWFAENPE